MSLLAGLLQLDGAPAASVDLPDWPDRPHHVPDSSGVFVDHSLVFAWRLRWHTPEAAAEHPPFTSPDQRFVVSYSGRLDNRADLIARYQLSGQVSDGDLFATVFARDGMNGLAHCVGDFVVAAWDRVDRRVWLARDAVGHRPLFYLHDTRRLVWSTDLRMLRRGVATTAAPNVGVLAEHLSGHLVSRTESVFAGIQRVPPAHAVTITPGDAAMRAIEYWTPPMTMPRRRPDAELIDEFRARFTQSVRACLRAYGPVAAELSGGLDSSSVVAVSAAEGAAAPATYSAVFPGTPFAGDGERLDESPFIDEMAAAVGASSFRWDPRTAGADDWLRALRVHGDLPDAPNADALRWPLARAAAESGHRVLLTGIGSDQWLTGSVARLPDLMRRGHWGEAWRFFHAAQGRDRLEASSGPMWQRIAAAMAPPLVRRLARRVRPARPWPSWMSDRFAESAGLRERYAQLTVGVPERGDRVLRELLLRLASAEGPYVRESVFRTANDTGVDARHPFFNRDLLEFMLTLPDDLRFRHGQTRYIVRQAIGPLLPPRIASRLDKGDGTTLYTHAIADVLAALPDHQYRVVDAGWAYGNGVRAALAPFRVPQSRLRVPLPADGSVWDLLAVECWLRAVEAGQA